MATRIGLLAPEDLMGELRSLVPEGQRSAFILEATPLQLLRERQRSALARTAGAWLVSEPDAPSDQDAVRSYLEDLRSSDLARERRLELQRDAG